LKTLFTLLVIAAIGWFAWNKYVGGPPRTFEKPVYGEMRATMNVQGREIEMAVFARMADESDCKLRALTSWSEALRNCPTCTLTPAKCQAQLPARYARLFNDEPIPSTYLSATAGKADERDGRVVVYGLTDQEGTAVCEVIRTVILERYRGTAHCVKASGG
jgi:hypothetical protein